MEKAIIKINGKVIGECKPIALPLLNGGCAHPKESVMEIAQGYSFCLVCKASFRPPPKVIVVEEIIYEDPQLSLQNEVIAKQSKQIDNDLRQIVLTYATPKIKGQITKGKLTWRGIKLMQRNESSRLVIWIEQRGVQIGKSIVVSVSINLNREV